MFDTAKMVMTSDGKKLNFFAAWGIAQVRSIDSYRIPLLYRRV